ncbi:hypothetical protein DCCM_0361 [Desulfocucumis palustris]|uniref:DUF1836 domain-containing protein n=1 Tax=Desulfocucumis palustris TaxID=1898651 RepID=A0A2L2X827_9FIRM|nr:DUF1836 domain-containing protein [Desulfocucumis palustris]GBF32170.1 hypothetical protein DCCM_0361 [Desulfocucumis palustris]
MFLKDDLAGLIDQLSLSADVKISDMPDIDLYIEQLTSLIDVKLSGHKREKNGKILTKTMVNNYTKAGLLMPPVNKKYSRDHFILLILIYYLKNILSINDIGKLFSPILNNIASRDDDVISLGEIYSTFLELVKIEIDSFSLSLMNKADLIMEKTAGVAGEKRDIAGLFLMVLMLVAQSNAQKRLAEKIIDTYFSAGD